MAATWLKQLRSDSAVFASIQALVTTHQEVETAIRAACWDTSDSAITPGNVKTILAWLDKIQEHKNLL